MKVLCTGAAGFMGGHLVDLLIDKGFNVYGCDDLSGGELENVNPECKFKEIDLSKDKITDEYIQEISPEVIFHLAATAREGASHFDPVNMIKRNINTYVNVLEGAIKTGGLKRVILFSSMAVYGNSIPPFNENIPKNPCDVYGQCKTFLENITYDLSLAHNFEYVIVRPHNVFGPRQYMKDRYRNVIMIWINSLLRSEKINIFGDGSHKRAFSYIEDSVKCYALCATFENCKNQIINIGGKIPYTLNEVSRIVLQEFFETFDISDIMRLKRQFVNYLPDRFREVPEAYCTAKKSEELLDYKDTYDLRMGIRETIIWAKGRGPQEWCSYKLPLANELIPISWRF